MVCYRFFHFDTLPYRVLHQPVQDEEWSNDEPYGIDEAADASMPDDSNNVWGEEPWRVTWFEIL